MRSNRAVRGTCAAMLAAVLAWGFYATAQEPKTTDPAKKADPGATMPKADDGKIRGRLPPYYNGIVDETQRQKIYQIEADYTSKMDAMQQQMDELKAERDAQIRGVLSAEQQKRLDQAISDAAARRAEAAKAKSTTPPMEMKKM